MSDIVQIISNAGRFNQRRVQVYSSRPMKIIYRKRRKTGPEKLPLKWVKEYLKDIDNNTIKYLKINPFDHSYIHTLSGRTIERKDLYTLLTNNLFANIDKMKAWVNKYSI